MDNFDLRKYLAENKLVKELEVSDVNVKNDAENIMKEFIQAVEKAFNSEEIFEKFENWVNSFMPGAIKEDLRKYLAEGKLLKENEEPTGFLFRFSKEDAMNKAMEILDQKDISYNELGVHLVFHDKFGPATEEEVSEILRGEDILDWVIGEWKGDIYLKSEEEIKNM